MSIDPVRRAELKQKAARLREDHTALLQSADSITDKAATAKRNLTQSEKDEHGKLIEQVRQIRDERERVLETLASGIDDTHGVDELRAIAYSGDDTRRTRGNAPHADGPRTRSIAGVTYQVTQRDPGHYTIDNRERSFFKDIELRAAGDHAASARISEHNAAVRDASPPELRNLYDNATDGAEALVPLYLQDRFEKYRADIAVTASLANRQALPQIGESVSIPYQTGAASVALQPSTSPLTALSETDPQFDRATAAVSMIGGTVSLDLYLQERGTLGANLDIVIGNHLADLLARDEDQRVLATLTADAGVSVTYTTGTPTLASFLPKAADAAQQIVTGNKMPPTAIVVHERRFYKWLSEVDDQNRPLMVPQSVAQNPIGSTTGTGAAMGAGATGYSIAGIPVYIDSNITTVAGSTTSQDLVFMGDFSKMYVWSSPVMIEVDRSIHFKTAGLAVRARAYHANMIEHRVDAFALISGTGLVSPGF